MLVPAVVLPARLTGPQSIFFAALSAALALMLAIGESGATVPVPIYPGRWTPVSSTSSQWSATEVHMVLLPGNGTTFHSQILAYRQSIADSLAGDLFQWNPNVDDDCSSYPASNFTRVHVTNPGFDVFCSSQIHLGADSGQVLVCGGTDARGDEIGITRSAIFNSVTRVWRPLPSMRRRRWYPTALLLGGGAGTG